MITIKCLNKIKEPGNDKWIRKQLKATGKILDINEKKRAMQLDVKNYEEFQGLIKGISIIKSKHFF